MFPKYLVPRIRKPRIGFAKLGHKLAAIGHLQCRSRLSLATVTGILRRAVMGGGLIDCLSPHTIRDLSLELAPPSKVPGKPRVLHSSTRTVALKQVNCWIFLACSHKIRCL